MKYSGGLADVEIHNRNMMKKKWGRNVNKTKAEAAKPTPQAVERGEIERNNYEAIKDRLGRGSAGYASRHKK